jgi:hypothetical protein
MASIGFSDGYRKVSRKARHGRHHSHPVPHKDHRRSKRLGMSRAARLRRLAAALAFAPTIKESLSDSDLAGLRPHASGVFLGAIGFTPSYRNGEPSVSAPGSHHPDPSRRSK